MIGGNDRTVVTESDGRTWVTREPAICYFHAQQWFNVIGMIREDGIDYTVISVRRSFMMTMKRSNILITI